MKPGPPLAFTYNGHLQTVHYARHAIDEQDVRQMLSQFERLGAAMCHTPPVFFAVDYTRAGYLVMTDATRMITSHDPREFLEGGIPYLINVFQKDDFRTYNEHIFPANVRFLQQQPRDRHRSFIFSYTFRVRHRDGTYIPVLQRGSYITSADTGLPLYSLGMVTDITPFKRDTLMYHTIEAVDHTPGNPTKRIMESNYFYPHEEDKLLSRTERNVLGYLAEGWSSKQIAWKMKISENTVANHRKNMLKKTNTKNVAELVAFACRNRII